MLKTIIFVLTLILLNCSLTFGGTFENVLKAFFYTQNDSSYLILHESFYNPTSGSYEQGNMRSQGYNTTRISVYDLNNGKLIAQKNMGVLDSAEACFLLGCSPNNLWLFSNKYKSGLQSFNPLTLERNNSQAKIYKLMNISIGRFYEPEWPEINKYYGFDAIQQKIIVTNQNMQQFYIDAETFATQPITNTVTLNPELNKYLAESVQFKDSTWKLDGYDQMKFKCGKYIAQSPMYLFGKFILEQNQVRLFKHYFAAQEKLMTLKALSNSVNPISESAIIDVLIKNSKDNIESLIEGNKPDDVLLQTDANSFFVLSKSDDTPSAFIKIAKIKSEEFGLFNEEWATPIPGLFYNIAEARNTKKFKQYYGDIFPEFNYQLIQVCDEKLVIIYQLFVNCIDINTGKVLWQFKLK